MRTPGRDPDRKRIHLEPLPVTVWQLVQSTRYRYGPGVLLVLAIALLLIGVIALVNGQPWGVLLVVVGVVLLFKLPASKKTREPSRSASNRRDPRSPLQQAPDRPSRPPLPGVVPPAVGLRQSFTEEASAPSPRPESSPARLLEPAAPAPVLEHKAEEAPSPARAIVTRTNANPERIELFDPFLSTERRWTASEDKALVDAYRRERRMAAIAEEIRVDQRQVALRVTRLLFDASGDLDDESQAPLHGRRWSRDEQQAVLLSFDRGETLSRIAASVGRTPLAVAWRILEHRPERVPVPAAAEAKWAQLR